MYPPAGLRACEPRIANGKVQMLLSNQGGISYGDRNRASQRGSRPGEGRWRQTRLYRGITEVYSVAGRYDLVAMVRVRTNEELADVVTNRMQRIDGIEVQKL
jgi:DNA-binding Lrp family transcriptional regulator